MSLKPFYKKATIKFPLFFLLIFVSMTIFLSCGDKKEKSTDSFFISPTSLPDSILPREKFVQIIADILTAESAVTQQYDPKESKLVRFEKYRYNIYKKHEIDSGYFMKNYNYYMKMPKRSELFLFIVEDTLQARKDSLRVE
jgi:lysozyme family protein